MCVCMYSCNDTYMLAYILAYIHRCKHTNTLQKYIPKRQTYTQQTKIQTHMQDTHVNMWTNTGEFAQGCIYHQCAGPGRGNVREVEQDNEIEMILPEVSRVRTRSHAISASSTPPATTPAAPPTSREP